MYRSCKEKDLEREQRSVKNKNTSTKAKETRFKNQREYFGYNELPRALARGFIYKQ